MSAIIRLESGRVFNTKLFAGRMFVHQEDKRSLVLEEVDLSKVDLISCLKKGEEFISGEERISRLKKRRRCIRLDASILSFLLHNHAIIPEEWKNKVLDRNHCISFDGTVLFDCIYFTMGLYWSQLTQEWGWLSCSFGSPARHYSAVVLY